MSAAVRIAELRRRIAGNKAKVKRARERTTALAYKAAECQQRIRADQAEIEALGGKVRR